MIFRCKCGFEQEIADEEIERLASQFGASSVRLITHTHRVERVDAVTGEKLEADFREVVVGEIQGTRSAPPSLSLGFSGGPNK